MERNFNPFGGNKIPPTEQTHHSKSSNTKEHLSKEQISVLKSSIENKIKEKMEEIEMIKTYRDEISDSEKTGISGDRIDRANEQNSFREALEMQGRIEKCNDFIKHLKGALERIEKGRYGFDVVTGEPIPYARLLACPGTTKNVSTKEGAL